MAGRGKDASFLEKQELEAKRQRLVDETSAIDDELEAIRQRLVDETSAIDDDLKRVNADIAKKKEFEKRAAPLKNSPTMTLDLVNDTAQLSLDAKN
jgi:Skp family chaperone for outer membrane proteins